MMRWATGVYTTANRCSIGIVDRFAIPKTRDPIRPLIDAETVEKLMAVADRVSPLMPLLITLDGFNRPASQ